MTERLYTDYPDLYDAIQAEWDYDRDVGFVESSREDHDVDGTRILEIGCGTGEHTRRFTDRGFDVTAVDPYEGMLGVAREKCDSLPTDTGTVEFRNSGLPDLDVEGQYDAAVAIRGVVNHLPPADLKPALNAVADRLVDGGVLVFDNSPLPPDGNEPGMGVGETEDGRYVRIAQMQARADDRLDWVSVNFLPDGDVVTTSRPMTPFADETIEFALKDVGFTVETEDGYGPGDNRTVFVAVN